MSDVQRSQSFSEQGSPRSHRQQVGILPLSLLMVHLLLARWCPPPPWYPRPPPPPPPPPWTSLMCPLPMAPGQREGGHGGSRYGAKDYFAQLGTLCCNWVLSKYQEVDSSNLVTDYKHNLKLSKYSLFCLILWQD